MSSEQLITVQRFARLTGISKRTVFRYLASEKLPYVQMPGGPKRIALSDLRTRFPKLYEVVLRAIEAEG